ncbi:MAG: HK97 family phage prohead protease [Rhodanobacter sp.]
MPRISNVPPFITDASSMRRDASVLSRDATARTVSLAFSSEIQVDRGSWIEVLSHSPGAVDLSRLNDGGAVLENHDWNAQRGVVESAWIDETDMRGRAVVRFSSTRQGVDLFTDVADGIKRHVSVGYHIVDAQVVGERDDGTPIVLATRWQPYEISIVTVPADTTVGIGRSARHPKERKSPSVPKSRNSGVRDTGLIGDLRAVLRDAMTAQPFRAHTPASAHRPTGYIPTPTKRSLILPLRTASLVGLFDADGNITHTPAGALAGEVVTMHGGIIANSRVAKAGAQVILRTESTNTFSVGNTLADVVLEHQPARFVNVDAVSFATVAEDADAPAVALASVVKAADLTANWGAAKMKAFSMELKRSDLHRAPVDDLLTEVMTAITQGLSRAADDVLLSAIAATAPDAFTLAALTSRGLRFGDVHALAGTSATGAAVGTDGVLRVAGVPAELTPDMAGSLIGEWSRAAVAINDEVTVIFERVNPNGRLKLSAWATMLPIIPDPSVFWTVGA